MVDISRFKAAVFDMDGVVVDTEPVYREHVLMFFREQGVDIGTDDVNVLAGAASDTYQRLLRQWWRDGTGKQATDQEIDALLDEFYERNPIDYASILNQGVRELLASLRSRGIPCALASSSSLADIHNVLRACRLEDAFDYVVSGEEFEESKPNPAIYLHVLDKLGVEAAGCFAIEDSDAGMTAAHRAGIYVVGKRDDRFGYAQTECDVLVDSIAELL